MIYDPRSAHLGSSPSLATASLASAPYNHQFTDQAFDPPQIGVLVFSRKCSWNSFGPSSPMFMTSSCMVSVAAPDVISVEAQPRLVRALKLSVEAYCFSTALPSVRFM
jgi:hypothetical protein